MRALLTKEFPVMGEMRFGDCGGRRETAGADSSAARYGDQGRPQKMLSEVSQEMLAEMIGTTRPRVNFS